MHHPLRLQSRAQFGIDARCASLGFDADAARQLFTGFDVDQMGFLTLENMQFLDERYLPKKVPHASIRITRYARTQFKLHVF